MDLEKVVCNCMHITNGMIKNAVEDGATSLKKVQDATGAGTICGTCFEDIEHLIDEFSKK